MSFTKRSLFDDLYKPMNLWEKKRRNLSESIEEKIYEGYLSKYSKKRDKYKLNFFILTQQELLYMKTKKSKVIYGFMKLKWVRNYYESFLYEGQKSFLITFVRNMKYSSFLATNEDEFLQWKTALSKVCIQTDFILCFKIMSLLGEGGFGKVYLAKDLQDNQLSALKIYPKEKFTEEPVNKLSLVREIEILKSLNHPNIISLKKIYETSNHIYLVFEYIQGIDLEKMITSKYQFSYAEVKIIFKILLECLIYLKSKRVVHRDLKPSNLIIIKNNEKTIKNLKIIDFGLSISMNNISDLHLCGTPGYIAPELFDKSKQLAYLYGAATDIFSIGATIFHIAHGKSPFESKNKYKILKKNKKCEINYSEDNEIHFPEINNIISEMLKFDPTKRITPEKALDHPIFDDLNTSYNKPNNCTIDSKLLQINNYENDSNCYLTKRPKKITLYASRDGGQFIS